MATLGIDFGTSNTAAGVAVNGSPYVIPLEPGENTLPTAIFLDFAARKTLYGTHAATAMIDGRDGRFMRSLKSILGTTLAREQRQFMNERMTLIQVIARFLKEIKERSEKATYQTYDRALSGRPVRFHSASADRDAQALVDLTEAYHLAGFKSVDFLPEPEAAALAVGGTGRILIVDIGGGTSDFTLCDRKGDDTQILASQGVRIGGTDFDKTLNLAHAMPLLGYGAEIGNEIGGGSHTAPRAPFHDLATWEKIAFVYGGGLVRDVRKWERLAKNPVLFARFGDVLEMHLGHDIAYAVEAGKIAANGHESALIRLDVIERGLSAEISNDIMQTLLASYAQDIANCASQTIAAADVAPDSIDRVVYVGGSSMMAIIRDHIEQVLPNAAPETSEVFTAVVNGLALAADAS